MIKYYVIKEEMKRNSFNSIAADGLYRNWYAHIQNDCGIKDVWVQYDNWYDREFEQYCGSKVVEIEKAPSINKIREVPAEQCADNDVSFYKPLQKIKQKSVKMGNGLQNLPDKYADKLISRFDYLINPQNNDCYSFSKLCKDSLADTLYSFFMEGANMAFSLLRQEKNVIDTTNMTKEDFVDWFHKKYKQMG